MNRKLIRRRRESRLSPSLPISVARAAQGQVEALEPRRLFSVVLNPAVAIPISAVPIGDPAAPVVADFDGDANPDVLIAFPSPTAIEPGFIQFGKGDGAGTFTFATESNVGIFTGRPVVGDFNGDTFQDLAVTNGFGGQVLVLPGNGDGTFADALSFTAGVSPESLAVGDFNADSFFDLVVGNRSSNTAQVFLGELTATLGTPLTLSTAGDPATVAVGDFNGDLTLDVLVGAAGSVAAPGSGLQVFAGNGDGTFITTPVNTPGPLGASAAADLNNDGIVDAVVGITAKDKPDVLLNNGDGTFRLAKGSTGTGGVSLPVALDMNEDTTPDLVTAVGGQIEVFTGLGDGTFTKAARFDAAGGSGPAAADVTGDGRPDVLTIGGSAGVQAGRSLNVSVAERVGPNFTIAFGTVPPPNILLGSIQKATVVVTNSGNERYRGEVPIQIITSTGTVGSEDDSILLQTFPRLNLNPGRSKVVKLKIEFGGGEGSFNLIARVDPFGTTGDLNTFDNIDIADQQVTLAQPFIDLAITKPVAPSGQLTPKTRSSVAVDVSNSGNITASGRVEFVLLASTDNIADQADASLQTFIKKIKIAPNSAKTFTFKFRPPATLPPASYFAIALVNTNGGVAEADVDNNVMASDGQFAVVP